jgi:hypothetical protein
MWKRCLVRQHSAASLPALRMAPLWSLQALAQLLRREQACAQRSQAVCRRAPCSAPTRLVLPQVQPAVDS